MVGGWQVAGTYNFQLGGPLTWLNGSTNNPGDYLYVGGPLASNPRNTDQAFDITRFDTKTADQYQYHVRNVFDHLPDVRSDGINNMDASLPKRFNFGEHRYFQLRAGSLQFPEPSGLRRSQYYSHELGVWDDHRDGQPLRAVQLVVF